MDIITQHNEHQQNLAACATRCERSMVDAEGIKKLKQMVFETRLIRPLTTDEKALATANGYW